MLLIAGGLALLIFGSGWLVDGSSSIARRLNVSDIVIGLTVVAFGTSSPELVVNLIASFNGSADIAIGNVLGSNIFNVFVILGITAVVMPVAVKNNTVWKEIPFSLLAVLVIFFVANDHIIDSYPNSEISRADGLVLLSFFSIFMAYTFILAKQSGPLIENEPETKTLSLSRAIIYIFAGLAGLFFGGRFLVDGAVAISRNIGLSESVIGLTVVAAGTSLPELATSITAAMRKKSDIAIGNVVGSNIFNIFLILGLSATIRPLPFNESSNFDIGTALISTLMMFMIIFTRKGRKIDRLEGGILFTSFIVYTVLILNQSR